MPSKKKKYNSRFPPGRIKKIMQTDEEVGKVAQAVPVIISRALELFVESLLTRAVEITSARNAKTLTPSHMKQCILSESRFDFLKEFVKTVPDLVGDTDDSPGPSGAPFLASSSMEESNPCSEPYAPTEHTNGVLPIKVDPDAYAGIQDVPLNLATTAPLHCSKSIPSAASSSAALDEDYDV